MTLSFGFINHVPGRNYCLDLIAEANRERDALREALLDADKFISNGLAFGYIQMPESGDSALATPARIKAALTEHGA